MNGRAHIHPHPDERNTEQMSKTLTTKETGKLAARHLARKAIFQAIVEAFINDTPGHVIDIARRLRISSSLIIHDMVNYPHYWDDIEIRMSKRGIVCTPTKAKLVAVIKGMQEELVQEDIPADDRCNWWDVHDSTLREMHAALARIQRGGAA